MQTGPMGFNNMSVKIPGSDLEQKIANLPLFSQALLQATS